MVRRFRFVRVLKWAGTLVCLLILAALVASAWYTIWWARSPREHIGIGGAQVYYAKSRVAPPEFALPGVYSTAHPFEFRLDFVWDVRYPSAAFVLVPLWFPFLVALAPTLLLWHRDRRVPPGHCRKCRYNLTGNTTGICPECGAAASACR